MKKLFLLFAISTIFWVGTVSATNITISDNNSASNSIWYDDFTQGWEQSDEDNEVEPGMSTGQQWDLEGFFTQGNKLSLVGGYDFENGESTYLSGDIFIDVDGSVFDIAQATNGYRSVKNLYGYDYVLDLGWNDAVPTLTYDVLAIDSTANVTTAYYQQNQGSSPWRYESGGTILSENVAIGYNPRTTAYDDRLSPDEDHNEVIVDLSFLYAELGLQQVNFIAHYTMGCGNDNLMGSGTIHNPEPATMLLLGFGLIGIAGLYRKNQN